MKKKSKAVKSNLYPVILRCIIIILLLVATALYFNYKSKYLLSYYITNSHYEINEADLGKENYISIKHNNEIKDPKTVGDVTYNDYFKKYELHVDDLTSANLGHSYKYYLKDDNDQITDQFWISDTTNFDYLEVFVHDYFSVNDDKKIVKEKEVKEFLKEENINSEIDLIKYLKNNYYFESGLFTSNKNIRKNYVFNNIFVFYRGKTVFIKGDYEGFIQDYYNSSLPVREVNLFKNGKKYTFTLMGKKLTSDSFIKEFVSTISIK